MVEASVCSFTLPSNRYWFPIIMVGTTPTLFSIVNSASLESKVWLRFLTQRLITASSKPQPCKQGFQNCAQKETASELLNKLKFLFHDKQLLQVHCLDPLPMHI